MLPIYILYAVNLVLVAILVLACIRKQQPKNAKRLSENIFFIGSLALLIGIFGQVLGIMQALDAFEAYDNVSLSVLAGGFRVTMIAPAYGLVLFVFSFIVWIVCRNLCLK